MRHISMLSAALESIEGRSESLTRQLCSTQTELASCKARYQTCFAAASSFHLCLFATAGSIPIVFHISHSRHDQVMLRCNGVRRVQVDRFRGVCRHHVSTAGCQHDRAAGTATRGAQVLGTLAVIMLHRYTGMVGKHISGSGMAVSWGGGGTACVVLPAALCCLQSAAGAPPGVGGMLWPPAWHRLTDWHGVPQLCIMLIASLISPLPCCVVLCYVQTTLCWRPASCMHPSAKHTI
jgi:hypothetical protein